MNQKGLKLALLGSLGSTAPSIGSSAPSIGPEAVLDVSAINDFTAKSDIPQDLSQTPTVRAFRAKRYIEQWFTKNCNFHIEDDNAIRYFYLKSIGAPTLV